MPASTGAAGDGTTAARQLDAALPDVGFSASRDLLAHVGGPATGPALDLAATVVSAVRELVGDHVRHNAYFIDCPTTTRTCARSWRVVRSTRRGTRWRDRPTGLGQAPSRSRSGHGGTIGPRPWAAVVRRGRRR
ncbi:hypothetical protein GCM10022243_37530 [Saccharothrix violaceirubra]